MTQHQIKVVKNTWRKLMMIDPILVADIFYTKLFNDHPKIRGLFPKDMSLQYQKMTDMMTLIVTSLDRQEDTNALIMMSAQSHIKFGVKAYHYEFVGHSLMWTLEKGLGHDWNDEVKEAWSICYAEWVNKMQNPVH